MSSTHLSFLGAARQVTGSCFLFERGRTAFLVDCGMFQGGRIGLERNYAPFAFDPARIAFVVLTHAHIDHSGLLPRLVKAGFRGPVYATAATHELLHIMLPDSAYVQEAEARRSWHGGRTAPEPLYSVADAQAVFPLLRSVRYDERMSPAPGVELCLRDAGHILGSAIAELWLKGNGGTTKVVVSGDLGQPGRPILRDPARIEHADILLLESTYGNRDHKPLDATLDEFVRTVNRTLWEKRGNVLVPAFAVGRTQELLYFFDRLTREGRLRAPRIYVDSPMAAQATALTARHPHLFDDEARGHAWPTRTDPGGPKLYFTESVQDSMALNDIEGGAVIIAASGMCSAGRIRHHLRHNLPRGNATVLITGFQAAGTLGRRLVDGASTVRLFGEEIPVRADIVTLGGFSAHADRTALLNWLGGFRRPPERTFLVHGEESVIQSFAEAIRARLGWSLEVPSIGDRFELVTSGR